MRKGWSSGLAEAAANNTRVRCIVDTMTVGGRGQKCTNVSNFARSLATLQVILFIYERDFLRVDEHIFAVHNFASYKRTSCSVAGAQPDCRLQWL